MEWWETLLSTALTCLITLVITYVFNWITNRPSKKKKEKEEFENAIKSQLEELDNKMQKTIEETIKNFEEKSSKQNLQCSIDHKRLVAVISSIQEDNKKQSEALQSLLKNNLKDKYVQYIKKGYAPLDVKEDLEKMYTCYHNLGANGTMDTLREKFMALPISKPEKHIDEK